MKNYFQSFSANEARLLNRVEVPNEKPKAEAESKNQTPEQKVEKVREAVTGKNEVVKETLLEKQAKDKVREMMKTRGVLAEYDAVNPKGTNSAAFENLSKAIVTLWEYLQNTKLPYQDAQTVGYTQKFYDLILPLETAKDARVRQQAPSMVEKELQQKGVMNPRGNASAFNDAVRFYGDYFTLKDAGQKANALNCYNQAIYQIISTQPQVSTKEAPKSAPVAGLTPEQQNEVNQIDADARTRNDYLFHKESVLAETATLKAETTKRLLSENTVRAKRAQIANEVTQEIVQKYDAKKEGKPNPIVSKRLREMVYAAMTNEKFAAQRDSIGAVTAEGKTQRATWEKNAQAIEDELEAPRKIASETKDRETIQKMNPESRARFEFGTIDINDKVIPGKEALNGEISKVLDLDPKYNQAVMDSDLRSLKAKNEDAFIYLTNALTERLSLGVERPVNVSPIDGIRLVPNGKNYRLEISDMVVDNKKVWVAEKAENGNLTIDLKVVQFIKNGGQISLIGLTGAESNSVSAVNESDGRLHIRNGDNDYYYRKVEQK